MTTFAVKYARGKNHIAGLDEVVNTGPDSLNYAKSACAALSKSSFWCTGRSSATLAEVLESARLYGGGKGVCLKCERSALAQLAKLKGCPNPWHASAPARMSTDCPECPVSALQAHAEECQTDGCATCADICGDCFSSLAGHCEECEECGCLGGCHDDGGPCEC